MGPTTTTTTPLWTPILIAQFETTQAECDQREQNLTILFYEIDQDCCDCDGTGANPCFDASPDESPDCYTCLGTGRV